MHLFVDKRPSKICPKKENENMGITTFKTDKKLLLKLIAFIFSAINKKNINNDIIDAINRFTIIKYGIFLFWRNTIK